METKIKLFFNHTPVEGNALEQLKQTAQLEGMIEAVGMPDLHLGKGHPIGAAFLTKGIIYPYLVGNDIGCGMSLHQLDIKTHKAKREKIVRQLGYLEDAYDGEVSDLEAKYTIKLDQFRHSLGTIGGSNHFLELLTLESVEDQTLFDEAGLIKNQLFLMTHTGSRGLGEQILSSHISKFNSEGLKEESPEFKIYLDKHNYAVTWAKVNRELLVRKVSEALGVDTTPILDIVHNWIKPHNGGYLHRKGTAPADDGLIVIPGSRGDFSYIVKPLHNDTNLASLAHGAGRKWKRSDSKARLSHKFSEDDLKITELKSQVICEDKDLLYEEAPLNYKKISKVIQDLEEFNLIKVVAILRPFITYKKKRRDDCCDKD